MHTSATSLLSDLEAAACKIVGKGAENMWDWACTWEHDGGIHVAAVCDPLACCLQLTIPRCFAAVHGCFGEIWQPQAHGQQPAEQLLLLKNAAHASTTYSCNMISHLII